MPRIGMTEVTEKQKARWEAIKMLGQYPALEGQRGDVLIVSAVDQIRGGRKHFYLHPNGSDTPVGAVLTEAEAEKILDSRVMSRLDTDREYNNAEDADAQQHREQKITAEEIRKMIASYFIPSWEEA
jgi:hypothetical protein